MFLATGFPVYVVAPLVCAVCIFYTTIGGLKAVVWTDNLQFGAMVCAIIAVIIVGTSDAGGIATVFSRAYEGGRLEIE